MHVREFAIGAHGDQKYGDLPYVTHLDQVWALLQEYGFSTELHELGAYLHDVLEDCGAPDEEPWGTKIIEEFGWDAYYIAKFCTNEHGRNRKTRKDLTYARCRKELNVFLLTPHLSLPTVPTMVQVKVADRLANIRSCIKVKPDLLQMYRKERDAFRDALWMERACDDMWAEYDRLLK